MKQAIPKLSTEKLTKLNEGIALKSNAIFSTMAFFYFCLIFSLIPLKWPATMPFVQYASSGVLQLIALPLLGVGTILAARASDKLATEQHAAVMETVADMRILMDEIHQMHKELHVKLGARPDKPEPWFKPDNQPPFVVPSACAPGEMPDPSTTTKTTWNDLTTQVVRSNLSPEEAQALRDRWLAEIVPNPAHQNPP